MKTKTKKLVALLLVVILLAMQTFGAAAIYEPTNLPKANTLRALGLFLGDANGNFNLEKMANRAEGAVMLVRMLGKESEAMNSYYDCPFTDVPSWALKYVAYMYGKKLTYGQSATKYGSANDLNYNEYITFVLRAMGYSDVNGDFVYSSAINKAYEISMLNESEYAVIKNSATIYRDTMVLVSYNALFTKMKYGGQTLLDKLYSTDKAISLEKLAAAASIDTKVDVYYDSIDRILSSVEISERVSPAVFSLTMYDKDNRAISMGSGFITAADGTAVTNYHVIEGAYSARASLPNGQSYNVSLVLGYDIDKDIAIIKLSGSNFPVVKLGDSSKIKNGEKIYTIGSPLGLSNTISEGIVSNNARVIENKTYIQITAPISPGSSGGALISEYGYVVGVTTATVNNDSAQNLNLAVPINLVKSQPRNANKTLAEVTEENLFQISFPRLDQSIVYEVEPNEYVGTEQEIAPDYTIKGSLSNADDLDVYTITLAQPCIFAAGAWINKPLYNDDMVIALFDANYNIVTVSIPMKDSKYGTYQIFAAELPAGKYYILAFTMSYSNSIWSGMGYKLYTTIWE